jgi:hypothetical protein
LLQVRVDVVHVATMRHGVMYVQWTWHCRYVATMYSLGSLGNPGGLGEAGYVDGIHKPTYAYHTLITHRPNKRAAIW